MRKGRNSARGQGLVEYAIVIVLIALLSVVVLLTVAGAVNRNYGIVGGVLGVRKDVQTVINGIYFDTNKPRCGSVSGGNLWLMMEFFSDVPIPDLSISTENPNLLPIIEDNGYHPPSSGIGDKKVNYQLPTGASCPQSVVIQSDAAYGSKTVVWNVLQQDWP